ncbi:uncharacterized protein LOC112344626 [Selaginella moellendorffii]|uniref:uncharacterized protein LOC112344626 n=1 Tax=Selaginella moellendorffii TaxID=88036 RepID=UPI000D1CC80A|nr:uncharacterized protein LOC112344626 [Selaginella moellendorffii]XP_024525481.1 uncharacterized protein LOC112344626 [Selaginella moellendorffii]|eukprot:XP_024525480.1 uncharacterized protein LOC112344626 [Selaginella moellendorffii]
MTSAVQRSGGTASHPTDSLDLELESMAARIEASSSGGSMGVGFRCLEEDLKTVFSIFSDVVQRPTMPREKLELVRGQLLGSISRRKDNAETLATIELQKLLYGDKSVYARLPEENTVGSISRNDLIAFHSHVFRPDSAVLGIWGDFDSSTMKSLIEKEFSAWRTPENINKFLPVKNDTMPEPVTSVSEPKVFLVDRPGLTQGYVRMGELGTTIADPDVFSLDVLNGVLNGFGGLLFDEIRSKEGLAYSVSGGWSPSIDHRGAFVAGGETQVQSVPRFLKAIKTVLMSIVETPVSEEKLSQAKEAALNSFVFNISSRESQLGRILIYDLFGIDQNLPFTYKKRVEEVTTDDILQAARRHLHPDLEPIVVVTDAKALGPQTPSFVPLRGR